MDFLKKNRASFVEIDFFKSQFTKTDIENLLALLKLSPREALRRKDKMYKELKLDTKAYNDKDLIGLMEKHPGLIQRPILVKGKKAVVALKPEMASDVL